MYPVGYNTIKFWGKKGHLTQLTSRNLGLVFSNFVAISKLGLVKEKKDFVKCDLIVIKILLSFDIFAVVHCYLVSRQKN